LRVLRQVGWPEHGFINKTMGTGTRSQALSFDKSATACGKRGATIGYFIAAPSVAASSGVVS
jgi:hypothetical protein